MDWLNGAVINGIGVVTLAVLLCALIWRGLLVTRREAENAAAQYQATIDRAYKEVAHWMQSADQWRAAFDSSQTIKQELVAQNTRLLASADITVRVLEEVRDRQGSS